MDDTIATELTADNGTIYTVAFCIIFIFTILINILLLLVFIRNPVFLSPSKFIYINLSCANISLALFGMTFGVVSCISGKWFFPSLVCDLVGFFNSIILYIAMFTAFSVTNERFHFVMNQKRHAQMYTSKRIGLTLIVHWTLSLLLSVIPFLPKVGSYQYQPHKGTCWSPPDLLIYLPLVVNSMYLTLWCYLVFNMLFIPKVELPSALTKSKKPVTFLNEVLTSAGYSASAFFFVIFIILHKLNVLDSNLEAIFEQITFLACYIAIGILMPLCAVLGNSELRQACKDVIKGRDRDGEMSLPTKYQQIPAQPYPYKCPDKSVSMVRLNSTQRVPITLDQKYMSLPMVHHSAEECQKRALQYRHEIQQQPFIRQCHTMSQSRLEHQQQIQKQLYHQQSRQICTTVTPSKQSRKVQQQQQEHHVVDMNSSYKTFTESSKTMSVEDPVVSSSSTDSTSTVTEIVEL